MDTPAAILAVRKILSIVPATAFLSTQRRARDQSGDRQKVPMPAVFGRRQ